MKRGARIRIGQLAVLAMVFSCLVPATSIAQARDVIRGTVTDSVTGAPIVGAKVTVRCPTCTGRLETDSLGRYAYGRLPNGYWEIEFHCPSRTLLGPEFARRRAIVGMEASEVNVVVPESACSEPPYAERYGVFRGFWDQAFEEERFTPCRDSASGIPEPLLPDRRALGARIGATLTPAAQRQVERWPERLAMLAGYAARQKIVLGMRYFVVWRGVFRGPGRYGHGGLSAFEIGVDSIIALRAPGVADCD